MSLKSKPHYTLSAAELADWVESQPERWWAADGEFELMSTLDFPCPSDEMAPALRAQMAFLMSWSDSDEEWLLVEMEGM